MEKGNQKRIAVINDLTGFGRCSIAVSLPIISAMKIECLVAPTAILSNHTGFEHAFINDYSDHLPAFLNGWNELSLSFDGIYTGYLGSPEEAKTVASFIDSNRQGSVVIVDPIMGDHGKPYSTSSEALCDAMKKLVEKADIITPNLTEACMLTGTPYSETLSDTMLAHIGDLLREMGPKKVVITGIPKEDAVGNLCSEEGQPPVMLMTPLAGHSRPGTGDVFASIIAASAVNDLSFRESILKASNFVADCIRESDANGIPEVEGVCFENLLYTLIN